MQLLNKFASRPIEESISTESRELSTTERFAKAKEDQIDGPILNKKKYKLADKELLVCRPAISFYRKEYWDMCNS